MLVAIIDISSYNEEKYRERGAIMRVFNHYTFTVGNTEFAGIFSLVDRFLQEQGLHYERLCCEIRDYTWEQEMRIAVAKDNRVIPNRKSAVVFGLRELLQDFLQFGTVGNLSADGTVYSDMDACGTPLSAGYTEEDVRSLAPQFPVPYYLESMLFSYVNIDFFSRKTAPVSEKSDANDHERMGRNGCHISFMKETVFCRAAKLVMVIEVTDGNGVLESEPYAQALAAILGKKYTAETVVLFSNEEQLAYDARKREVQTIAQLASCKFAAEAARFGQQKHIGQRDFQLQLFQASKNLKKIGKTFGFQAYQYDPFGVHFLSTGIGAGHTLTFVVDVPPLWNTMRFSVHLSGLGFSYRMQIAEVYCEDQEEADRQIKTAFEIIRDLTDQELLPICSHYPETPSWYVPNMK